MAVKNSIQWLLLYYPTERDNFCFMFLCFFKHPITMLYDDEQRKAPTREIPRSYVLSHSVFAQSGLVNR